LIKEFKSLKVSEDCTNDTVNVLLVGAADLRHVLKTCAFRARKKIKAELNFYIVENNLEVIARQILLLSIILESKESLGLKEKVELFLELFGNSLIRPLTNEFLQQRAKELITLVTNPDHLEKTLPVLNLSNLKFKEHDVLEGILKFWRNDDKKYFDLPSHWDQRVRQHLGTRYDSRANAYDWDYTMKLKEKAPIVNFREYKTWRESGVAFELRDDSAYEISNRTLASGIIFKKDGERFARRGYWGDILNSPFISYGIESEDKTLFKKSNDVYVKTSTNVAEHNVTSWIYELITGEKYNLNPSTSSTTENQSPREELCSISEKAGGKDESCPEDEAKCREKVETTRYFSLEDIKINILPINCVPDLSRKAKYKQLFDVLYFSNSMVHLLRDDIKPIVAENAKLIIESTNFMLDLRHENRVEYNKKIKAMAESLGFSMDGECDAVKDPFAFFSLKS